MASPSYPVFVINMERDAARRDYMKQLLGGLGMAAEFIPATDGSKLTPADRAAYDNDKALRIYGHPMLDNEIGCCLSHYRLYERMARDNIPAALILEDDIEIDPSLPRIIGELLAEPNPSWNVVRLSSTRGRVVNPKNEKDRGKLIAKLSEGELYRLNIHVLGFCGYLIRLEGARRMLDYGRRIFMPADQTMDRFWENGIVPYIVRPFPVRAHESFSSSIGDRPPGRHLEQPLRVRLWRRWQRIADGIKKRLFVLLYP